MYHYNNIEKTPGYMQHVLNTLLLHGWELSSDRIEDYDQVQQNWLLNDYKHLQNNL